MNRILEPELMDDEIQVRTYAEANFEEAHNNFIHLFKNTFGQNISGYVLDLGCGHGDITRRFARAYPHCIVHGVDGSETMIRYGRRILTEAKDIGNRIELFQGVLPNIILPQSRYDAIISNSLLHHLHNPAILYETMKRYAAPGAPVLIMDLKRVKTIEEAHDLASRYVSNEPEILKRDFYNSLLAAFEVEEIITQLQEAKLGHLTVKVISDHHIAIIGYAK